MHPITLDALLDANPTVDAPALLAIAQSDPRMVHAIATSDLNPWLGNNGITPRIQRTADFIAALDVATARSILAIDPATPDGKVLVIARLTADQLLAFTTYAASGLPFAVDTPDVAGKVAKLLALCIGLNTSNPTLGVTSEEADALVSLGGGYLLKDATLEDVTAALAARDARLAREVPIAALEQANRDRYNANVEKLAGLRTSADLVPATLAEIDAMGAS